MQKPYYKDQFIDVKNDSLLSNGKSIKYKLESVKEKF
jgi:hypothetical protein